MAAPNPNPLPGEGEPAPPKLNRVFVACLPCKARRTRCDGGHPCAGCTLRHKDCVYDVNPPKKRGPKVKALKPHTSPSRGKGASAFGRDSPESENASSFGGGDGELEHGDLPRGMPSPLAALAASAAAVADARDAAAARSVAASNSAGVGGKGDAAAAKRRRLNSGSGGSGSISGGAPLPDPRTANGLPWILDGPTAPGAPPSQYAGRVHAPSAFAGADLGGSGGFRGKRARPVGQSAYASGGGGGYSQHHVASVAAAAAAADARSIEPRGVPEHISLDDIFNANQALHPSVQEQGMLRSYFLTMAIKPIHVVDETAFYEALRLATQGLPPQGSVSTSLRPQHREAATSSSRRAGYPASAAAGFYSGGALGAPVSGGNGAGGADAQAGATSSATAAAAATAPHPPWDNGQLTAVDWEVEGEECGSSAPAVSAPGEGGADAVMSGDAGSGSSSSSSGLTTPAPRHGGSGGGAPFSFPLSAHSDDGAEGGGSRMIVGDDEATALGFRVLYYTLLAVGANIQGRRELSKEYQRLAAVYSTPCYLRPSEAFVIALCVTPKGKPVSGQGGGHALVVTAALTDYLSRIVSVKARVRLTASLQYRYVCGIATVPPPQTFRVPMGQTRSIGAAAAAPTGALSASSSAPSSSSSAATTTATVSPAALAAFQADESPDALLPGFHPPTRRIVALDRLVEITAFLWIDLMEDLSFAVDIPTARRLASFADEVAVLDEYIPLMPLGQTVIIRAVVRIILALRFDAPEMFHASEACRVLAAAWMVGRDPNIGALPMLHFAARIVLAFRAAREKLDWRVSGAGTGAGTGAGAAAPPSSSAQFIRSPEVQAANSAATRILLEAARQGTLGNIVSMTAAAMMYHHHLESTGSAASAAGGGKGVSAGGGGAGKGSGAGKGPGAGAGAGKGPGAGAGKGSGPGAGKSGVGKGVAPTGASASGEDASASASTATPPLTASSATVSSSSSSTLTLGSGGGGGAASAFHDGAGPTQGGQFAARPLHAQSSYGSGSSSSSSSIISGGVSIVSGSRSGGRGILDCALPVLPSASLPGQPPPPFSKAVATVQAAIDYLLATTPGAAGDGATAGAVAALALALGTQQARPSLAAPTAVGAAPEFSPRSGTAMSQSATSLGGAAAAHRRRPEPEAAGALGGGLLSMAAAAGWAAPPLPSAHLQLSLQAAMLPPVNRPIGRAASAAGSTSSREWGLILPVSGGAAPAASASKPAPLQSSAVRSSGDQRGGAAAVAPASSPDGGSGTSLASSSAWIPRNGADAASSAAAAASGAPPPPAASHSQSQSQQQQQQQQPVPQQPPSPLPPVRERASSASVRVPIDVEAAGLSGSRGQQPHAAAAALSLISGVDDDRFAGADAADVDTASLLHFVSMASSSSHRGGGGVAMRGGGVGVGGGGGEETGSTIDTSGMLPDLRLQASSSSLGPIGLRSPEGSLSLGFGDIMDAEGRPKLSFLDLALGAESGVALI